MVYWPTWMAASSYAKCRFKIPRTNSCCPTSRFIWKLRNNLHTPKKTHWINSSLKLNSWAQQNMGKGVPAVPPVSLSNGSFVNKSKPGFAIITWNNPKKLEKPCITKGQYLSIFRGPIFPCNKVLMVDPENKKCWCFLTIVSGFNISNPSETY